MAQAIPEKNQAKQTDEIIGIEELIKRVTTFENLLRGSRAEKYKHTLQDLRNALDSIKALTLDQVGSLLLEHSMDPQKALERFKSFVAQGTVMVVATKYEKDTSTVKGYLTSIAKKRSDSSYFSRNLLRCVFFKDSSDPEYLKDSKNITLADISGNVILLSLAKLSMTRVLDVQCPAHSMLKKFDEDEKALTILTTERFTTPLVISENVGDDGAVPASIQNAINQVVLCYAKRENPKKFGVLAPEDLNTLAKRPLAILAANVAVQFCKHIEKASLTPETEASIAMSLLKFMDGILKVQGEKTRDNIFWGSDMRTALKGEIEKSNSSITEASLVFIMAGVLDVIVNAPTSEKTAEPGFRVTGNQLLESLSLLYKELASKKTAAKSAESNDVETLGEEEELAKAFKPL